MSAGRVRVDILFVADPRFEGGASTALAAEIDAAARVGFCCGLLMVKGPLLGVPMPVHPQLRAMIDRGAVALIDPGEAIDASIVLIHHPTIFSQPPARRPRVATGPVVLVLHHPRLDQVGDVQYDLPGVVEICRSVFGQPIWLAPVSSVVRESLQLALPKDAALLPEDWLNLIDVAAWEARRERDPLYPVVIGRHARPDPAKWPEERSEALLAYPEDKSRYRIRILGGGMFLEDLYGTLPRNWDVLPFDPNGVGTFLQSLDFYVYFHGPVWLEAFGRTMLEAICARVLVILPPAFEGLFGPAAVYCDIAEVEATIDRFVKDPEAYRAQITGAYEHAAAVFDLAQFAPRLERLFDVVPTVAPTKPVVRPALAPATILFLSTNGIGLGHLTQQFAIARRLPAECRAVFGTMSLALKIAVEAGYETHFLPHHHVLGAHHARWNPILAEELFDLIAFVRPRLIAYDGTMPFDGLVRALACFPEIPSVWVRRPFWREFHRVALAGSPAFTFIVEPGELAERFDHGPTVAERERVYLVPPVLHHDPSERLDRNAARAALGVGPDDVVVALQLGSGANYDLEGTRAAIIAALLRHPNALVLEIESPIGHLTDPPPPHASRHIRRTLYPSFPLSRGFDLAVSAIGYNAFHEAIFGAIPTLFVPNEAPEMDVQAARGHYARLHNLGRMVRRDHDRFHIAEAVDELFDPDVRAGIRRSCEAIPYQDGAGELARFMAESARFLRTDIDPTRAFDRHG